MIYKNIFVVLLSILSIAISADETEKNLWHVLKEDGYVSLLRHAQAPGVGDPTNFDISDCSTQRNLDNLGRKQASDIGDLYRQHGITKAEVFSSQWCRSLDTARLLNLGTVNELPILNPFFQYYERQRKQTRSLKLWLQSKNLSKPTILVTHQVNITALTGVVPAQVRWSLFLWIT